MTDLHLSNSDISTHSPKPHPIKWVILLALAVVLAALVAGPHVRSSQVQALLDQGDAQRADYLYLSAAASYRQAAQLDPSDPEPLLRLGDVTIAAGQYVDAAQAYASASRLTGNTPTIHAGLARALEGNGDLAGAADHWQQVTAQQPGNAQARLDLARVLIAQDKWDDAQAALTSLLEQQPNNAKAHYLLGQILALDEPDAARAHFQAAAQDPAYVVNATDWLAILGGSDDAAYRAARIGRLSLTRGQLHQAQRAFERAVELNPAYTEARAYLGHTLDEMGLEGGPQLAQAVNESPDSVIVQYLWGLHLRQTGDLAGAKAAFQAALVWDPSNAALAAEIGLTALQGHDYVEGETWLVKASELEPQNVAWAKQLAHFYLDTMIAVAEKGLPSAQQAVRLAPDDAEAHDLLGWAYYLTGDLTNAQAELQRARALDSRSASAHYHMAAVLTALKQPAAARLETERAASLDPSGDIGKRAREMLGNK